MPFIVSVKNNVQDLLLYNPMLNSSQNEMQCILKHKALNYIAFYTVQRFTLGKLIIKHKWFLWVMSFALHFSLNSAEIVPQLTKFTINHKPAQNWESKQDNQSNTTIQITISTCTWLDITCHVISLLDKIDLYFIKKNYVQETRYQ